MIGTAIESQTKLFVNRDQRHDSVGTGYQAFQGTLDSALTWSARHHFSHVIRCSS